MYQSIQIAALQMAAMPEFNEALVLMF